MISWVDWYDTAHMIKNECHIIQNRWKNCRNWKNEWTNQSSILILYKNERDS